MSSLLARAQADIDIAKLLLSPEGNPNIVENKSLGSNPCSPAKETR